MPKASKSVSRDLAKDQTPGSDSDRKAVQTEYSRGLGELNQDVELFIQEFPEGAYGAPADDAGLSSAVRDERVLGNRERARRGAFAKPADAKREFELGGGRDGG